MEKKHNKNREFKVSELSPLSPVGLQNRVPAGIRRSKSRGAWERVLFSPSRVRDETRVKVIILATGAAESAAGKGSWSSAMAPVLNRPLLEYTVGFLKNLGIRDLIFVSSAEQDDPVGRYFGDGSKMGIEIEYTYPRSPSGTAGALRSVDLPLDGSLLVISGTTFFCGMNVGKQIVEALSRHASHRAMATALVSEREKEGAIESVETQGDGAFNRFHVLHRSAERRRLLQGCGLYILHPGAIQFIPREGPFDIEHQLLPALLEKGLRVENYQVPETAISAVRSPEDYYLLNNRLLTVPSPELQRERLGSSYRELLDGIWVGRNVTISPTAHLLGPVLLGDGCWVEDHADIIGPAILGTGTRVRENAFLRESVTWENVVLERGSRTAFCVLESSVVVAAGEERTRSVLNPESRSIQDLNPIMPQERILDDPDLSRISFSDHFRRSVFWASKRGMDVFLAGLGILMVFPLLLVIGLMVKLDSPGPIFFRQRRCGRHGKAFWMIKFRTMVANAHQKQSALRTRNDVDGPVFKMFNDPRITRLGRVLRKTSLDELPQLINVLRGEMSLVGPRPLMMSEMKCSPAWRDLRLSVKPGLTGLWQLRGRSRPGFHEWVRQDIAYVRNQSLLLDIRILLQTAWVILKGI